MNSYKIKDLITIHNGTKYNHLNDGSIPVYGSGGIMCFVDNFLYEGEAVLLPRKGTLNNIMYTNSKIWTVDTMYYATTNSLVLPYYLYCYLSLLDLTHLDSGSTLPSMTKASYNEIEVQLPEIKVQHKVADVISTIDKKIELNNKINTELEAMAKLIYDYWFVQFDFPDANGKPYKSSGGKMVYNEELKREIPDGWGGANVGNILNTDLGGTPSTNIKKYWSGDIPWLNSGEIANFPIIESEEHTTVTGIDNSATTLMPKGTCVLSITRHLRPSILAVDACANQSVVGIYESEKIKSSYLYPYLKNEIPRLMSLRTGAQQPHINKGIVDASPIVIPTDNILKSYYKKVVNIYKKINNNAFQNNELIKLRDWLLPMLMNGQVTVKDC